MFTRLAIYTAACFCIVAPTVAQPIVIETTVPSVTISYADLNLASPSGRAALERRATQAAQSLCVESGRKDLNTAQMERRCLTEVMAKAHTAIRATAVRLAKGVDPQAVVLVAAR